MLNKSFRNGFIPRVLMKNPGTYKMLEKVYTRDADSLIDQYFVNSYAGQALRDRLEAVVNYGIKTIPVISANPGPLKIVNYGCGTARDTIRIFSTLRNIDARIDCLDIDSDALKKAEILIKEEELDNFRLINKNFLNADYRREIDIGLMIGILCSLESNDCITILKKIRRHFKKSGLLIASNVSTLMKEKDYGMAYVLKRVIGWNLVYKSQKDLKSIFEMAGYEWKGCFYDEPLKFHIMGIGVPKQDFVSNKL